MMADEFDSIFIVGLQDDNILDGYKDLIAQAQIRYLLIRESDDLDVANE